MQGNAWRTAALIAGVAMAVPAGAQQVAQATAPERPDDARTAVLRFLERDEVRRAGSLIRIDTRELAGRVDDMSASERERIASRVADYEDRAATSDVVSLSTTTIIIALLVLIVLILIL